jgi:DNA (cytosine-5)-methyltransferase 1
MTHGSLFSGIGGFDLAAEWMGWENVFHCEWNEFGKKVLNYYWPKAISYHDITKTDFTIHRGKIDILTGGFPCQPYSSAGKRKGKEDERHLWPQMLRAIREIQPRWVVGENVLGLVNWSGGLVFHEVQADLEAAGYEVWPYVLPAVSVNAPHRRDRVWFVAYAKEFGSPISKLGEKESGKQIQAGGNFNGFKSLGPTPHPNGIRLQQCEDSGKMGGGQAEMGGQRSESTNAIETNGEESTTSHPNGNGFNQRNCNDENEYGDVADTTSERFCGDSSREQSQSSTFGTRNGMGKWDAADTSHTGLQGSQVNGSTGGSRKESDKFTTGCVRSNWQNFPTQSPICSRNDGFSSKLDGITFSKWRNESIKAAGNAIVPQVVLMIFKAIQQYETLPRMADKVLSD